MLKTIFESLLPTNIKDIEMVSDALDIFLDFIENNSDIALDIRNIYNQNNPKTKNEFIKVYFYILYTVFNNARAGDKLRNSFINDLLLNSDGNFIVPTIPEVSSIMGEEQYIAQKLTKTQKGTPASFKNMYEFALNSGFLSNVYNDLQIDYEYKEGDNVFEYEVFGVMTPEMYALLIAPMVHPLGWSYVYSRLQKQYLFDYFNVDLDYNIATFDVNCLNNDNADNYLTGLDREGLPLPTYIDPWNTISDYIKGDVVQESGSFWLCLVDNTNSAPTVMNANWQSKEHSIALIEQIKLVDGYDTIITFLTGHIMRSTTSPISTKLYEDHTRQNILIDYNDPNDTSNSQCSLLLEFIPNITTNVGDKLRWEENISIIEYNDLHFGGSAHIKGKFTGVISQNYITTGSTQVPSLVTNNIIFYNAMSGSTSGPGGGYGIIGEYYNYNGAGLTQDLDTINFLDENIFTPIISTWPTDGDFINQSIIDSFTINGFVYTRRISDEILVELILI